MKPPASDKLNYMSDITSCLNKLQEKGFADQYQARTLIDAYAYYACEEVEELMVAVENIIKKCPLTIGNLLFL